MKIKNLSDTYTYQLDSKKNYDTLLNAVYYGKRISIADIESPKFKAVDNYINAYSLIPELRNILVSNRVVLLETNKMLPIGFRVLTSRDVLDPSKSVKVFIAVNDIITEQGGVYKVDNNNKVLLAQLFDAYVRTKIHSETGGSKFLNTAMIEALLKAYVQLSMRVLDKLNILKTMDIDVIKAILGQFFMHNLLGYRLEMSENIVLRTLDIYKGNYKPLIDLQIINYDNLKDINTLVNTIKTVFKLPNQFTTSSYIQTWVYLYGAGTHFALELIESFSAMLTNTYIGSYLNNQKTIEKVCGGSINIYVKEILRGR